MSDETEGMTKEEELRHARHELGNVLTAIRGYALLLSEDLEKDSEPHSFAVRILEAVARGAGVLETMRN